MTKQILVGGVPIGGGAPVVIQSMLNTKTTDVEGSLKQIRQLASAGCQIARLAVPNMEAARSFADICKDSPLPLVADIHFDYRLAIAAAEGGASKIRINPGNIGGEDRVKAVVEVCKDKHIPIRIGVNGGSLDKRLLEKYGHPTAEALVESAFEHLELLEKQGFYDTCVSMKSSTVPTMVAAARLFRAKCDYPLHIGVTETGPVRQGLIKSAMGIGALPGCGALSFAMACAVAGFGGLSVHCQTLLFTEGAGLRSKKYFLGKTLQGVISFPLGYGVYRLFYGDAAAFTGTAVRIEPAPVSHILLVLAAACAGIVFLRRILFPEK